MLTDRQVVVPSSEMENRRMKWKCMEKISLILFLNLKCLWRQRVGNMDLYFRREVWARDTYLKIIRTPMGVGHLEDEDPH